MNRGQLAAAHHRQQRGPPLLFLLAACFMGCLVAFYTGVLVGMSLTTNSDHDIISQQQQQQQDQHRISCPQCNCPPPPDCTAAPQARAMVEKQEEKKSVDDNKCPKESPCPKCEKMKNKNNDNANDVMESGQFPSTVSGYISSMALVNLENFLNHFDTGIPGPLGGMNPRSKDVLLFFQNQDAHPRWEQHLQQQRKNKKGKNKKDNSNKDDNDPKLLLFDDSLEATKNCDIVHVLPTKIMHPHHRQCLAMVPQVQSHHLARFMRIPPHDNKQPNNGILPLDGPRTLPVNSSVGFRRVGRGHEPSGVNEFVVPGKWAIRLNWKYLGRYFHNIETIRRELGHILFTMTGQQVIARGKRDKPPASVVVMVCNYGQSELLINFACNARSKQLDLSKVLVICTDDETFQIATRLGLYAYHDIHNFQETPKEEASRYGDRTFRDMMMVKAIAVQIVLQFGFHVLFQDVDIVWNEHPLDYFQSNYLDWDILFQDDGARSVRFAPYEGNSGFYYCRYNPRTVYALTSLVLQGDVTLMAMSHQQALMAVLAEQSSLYGLRVKTMPGHDFPCGQHYHRDVKFMKRLLRNEVHPPMFHMSWTESKVNKVKFMQQMGFWHVESKCTSIENNDNNKNNETLQNALKCCSTEPRIICHFSDKASIKACTGSPALDKGHPDFWAHYMKQ